MLTFHTRLLTILLPGLIAASGASAANIFVSHFGGDVSTLSLTSSGNETYSLTLASSLKTCGQLPAWLSLDSASGTLYCTDEWWNADSTVTSLSIGADGALTETAQATALGGGVHNGLYEGADGALYLATSHYSLSTLSTFALPLESTSTTLQSIEFTMDGPGPVPDRQDAPHPHQAIADPTGAFLLSPDLGADVIHVFTIDKATGNLEECPDLTMGPGSGPRHATFWAPPAAETKKQAAAPEGTMMYVANELSATVSAFTLSYPADGCLSAEETQTLSPYGEDESPEGASTAEVTIVDNFLYLSNRGDQSFAPYDSITTYSLDAAGALTFQDISSSYGSYPRTFVINKAGTLIAIGDQVTANVAVVARDVKTGKLGRKLATLEVGEDGIEGQEEGISGIVWDE